MNNDMISFPIHSFPLHGFGLQYNLEKDIEGTTVQCDVCCWTLRDAFTILRKDLSLFAKHLYYA